MLVTNHRVNLVVYKHSLTLKCEPCLPGVLLNAVNGRGAGGTVIHYKSLADVGRVGGPVLR